MQLNSKHIQFIYVICMYLICSNAHSFSILLLFISLLFLLLLFSSLSLSNYTILSISCPLSDIVKVAARDGDVIEEASMRIQRYLCRNHSDEKLEMKLAKIRQKTLLATSQQSVSIFLHVFTVSVM